MRVMMIGPYPTTPARIDGGVAAAVTYLSQALALDPRVDLVGVRITWNGRDSIEGDGLGWPVVDLPLGRFSVSTAYRRQRQHFSRLILKHKPDIVHGQGADLGGYLAVNCGLPSIVTVHGLLSECARFQTNIVARLRSTLAGLLTEYPTIRRARHLIAISPYVSRYYGRKIKGRIYDIPNAVSASYFQISRSSEAGRLLYAGRISNGKGLMDLVQAVARNRLLVSALIIAGASPDPAYERVLRAEVERLGLTTKVKFVGLLDETKMVAEFSRAAALVLPSYQETAPMVIQQAMAAGLPVIASQVGGIPSQIRDGATGLLFRPGDVGRLAELLRSLLTDIALSGRLAEAAKAVAATFSAPAVASNTVAVYESILSADGRGAQQDRR